MDFLKFAPQVLAKLTACGKRAEMFTSLKAFHESEIGQEWLKDPAFEIVRFAGCWHFFKNQELVYDDMLTDPMTYQGAKIVLLRSRGRTDEDTVLRVVDAICKTDVKSVVYYLKQ